MHYYLFTGKTGKCLLENQTDKIRIITYYVCWILNTHIQVKYPYIRQTHIHGRFSCISHNYIHKYLVYERRFDALSFEEDHIILHYILIITCWRSNIGVVSVFMMCGLDAQNYTSQTMFLNKYACRNHTSSRSWECELKKIQAISLVLSISIEGNFTLNFIAATKIGQFICISGQKSITFSAQRVCAPLIVCTTFTC